MRVFAVSGFSGTGKTTLVEAIIISLVKSGHSVATIKSSRHQAGPDRGTDTWRHMQAGASLSIFLGPGTESTRFADRIGPDEMERLSKYDYLIVEGMKSVDIPRFWCIGDTEIKPDDIPMNTQAIVSWSNRENDAGVGIRIINIDETEELVEIVKTRALNISEVA